LSEPGQTPRGRSRSRERARTLIESLIQASRRVISLALRQFQKEKGLAPTGCLDNEMIAQFNL